MTSFSQCKIRQISIESRIKSILKKNSLVLPSTHGILIGSRAVRHYLPNFRGIHHDQHANWDIICSSEFFLAWWSEQNNRIKTIDMIIPKSKDGNKLDFYINCILQDESKYNFIIPQSSLTYSAYLLENSKDWIKERIPWKEVIRKGKCILNASAKFLLIFKKYMLYYPDQWMKIAKDYRELLTIVDPLTDDDKELCDLFVDYNEKIYGKRSVDAWENINVNRNEFFQWKNSQRVEFVYQTAMSMSITGDILIGFEHLCIQSPLWLADYVIDNWLLIQNEKFNRKIHLPRSYIKYEVDNHCLFLQLPKNVLQRILHNITNASDFYPMQFVCKRWYGIFQEESFWQEIYISRYGNYSTNISWKMLYLMRIEGQSVDEELINASMDLRQLTGNDIWKLWEDLTHREQQVDSMILSKIDMILSNAFYYEIEETADQYSVKLIINDFEDIQSLLRVHLIVHINEYKSALFTDHMEELSIECKSNEKIKYSLKLCAPNLFGFDFDCLGYISTENVLLTSTSNIELPAFPNGLLICLFIMMTHPIHRKQFITYLKNLENRCLEKVSHA